MVPLECSKLCEVASIAPHPKTGRVENVQMLCTLANGELTLGAQ